MELEASSDGEVKDGRMTMKVDRTCIATSHKKAIRSKKLLGTSACAARKWTSSNPSDDFDAPESVHRSPYESILALDSYGDYIMLYNHHTT